MANTTLDPLERSVTSAGVPLVVFEHVPEEASEPLVVFLPGAIHMARVAYGTGGAQPEDFLAHWLADAGHPFVAISYPVELASPAFDAVDPDLELIAYTQAVAHYVANLVHAHDLDRNVVVLGWSAAGNAVPRLNRAMAQAGLHLSLFVGLAATPPLPGLIFGSLEAASQWAGSDGAFTSDGLLAHAGLRSFLPELTETDRRYGRTIISEDEYLRSYVGNMPLNLFPGLDTRREKGEVIVSHESSLVTSQGAMWNSYPLVASLQPTWSTDARHATTDQWNWGFVLSNALQARLPADTHSRFAAQAPTGDAWAELVELINIAPQRMNRVIEGGHMFFVGRAGARQTVELVSELRSEAEQLSASFAALLSAANRS